MLRNLVLIFLFLLQGCLIFQKITINGKGEIRLKQVDFASLNSWENDNHKKALQAFLHSCNKFSRIAQDRPLGGHIGNITTGDFHDVCEIAEVVKTMSVKQTQNFFENWFKPFRVERQLGGSKGVFTGYYEASLNGSRVKTERFRYPVYTRPKNLTSEPYLKREEIEAGALAGKGLELLYVDDKVDLFFMHIQGSGRVHLPNGEEIRLTYAGRNNHPFTAVSNYMMDQGWIDRKNVSAATVKEWLKENPEKADKVMNINAAYTFFKFSDGEYVVGGQGVPLTTERSLAVDSEIIPYGLPIWIDTNLRKRDGSKEKYAHLFIAQDTGSAIKGTVRGDIFFGYGMKAEEKASFMAAQGQYYILLPINVVDKLTRK